MSAAPPKRRKAATPNAAALAPLGAARLAALLAAAAKADRALMRALSLELAAAHGDLGEEIDSQIARLRTAKGRLDARRAKALAHELEGLLTAIVQTLGAEDAPAGLARLFDLISLGEPLLARRTYDADVLVEVFEGAQQHVGELLARSLGSPRRDDLAVAAYRLFVADDLGLADTLITQTIGALDEAGRAALRQVIEADLQALEAKAGRHGPPRDALVKLTDALCDVADAEGDVDAFIAARRRRGDGGGDAQIAARLLQAGRASQAAAVLENAKPGPEQPAALLSSLNIDVLEALGQGDAAQSERWSLFQATLSAPVLRAYLKRLPDFEDVDREDAALDWVAQPPRLLEALSFLVQWPDLRRAGALVRQRLKFISGGAFMILAPAADTLAQKDPLAATLLYRRMISDTLRNRHSARYGHAARYLDDCFSLAATITDWEGWPTHDIFLAGLKSEHERKPGFWKRSSSA